MADLSSRQRAHIPTLPTANSSYYRALRTLNTANLPSTYQHLKRAGGHMYHHYPLQIPHITDSIFQMPPPISGARMQISHSSVQIPHTTGHFGH